MRLSVRRVAIFIAGDEQEIGGDLADMDIVGDTEGDMCRGLGDLDPVCHQVMAFTPNWIAEALTVVQSRVVAGSVSQMATLAV